MDAFSLDGIELGKLVLSSGLLQISWKKISDESPVNQDSALVYKIHEEEKFTIVVFTAPPISSNSSAPTLLPGSQVPNPFHFLRSEEVSSFSVHTPAFELFAAANNNLSDLKTELLNLVKSRPVIITGAVLGGAVASLFTLWLLESIDPKLIPKRPLCITFGSPLIGDASLQQILEDSVRSSCFLHVVDAAKNPITTGLTPIGTFLICFDSECICIEDHEAVMALLLGGASTDFIDYSDVLRRLDQSVMSMADSGLMIDEVIDELKKRAKGKNPGFDSFEKLNHMKIIMMHMEWYKTKSKVERAGNYYDDYRSKYQSPMAQKVERMKTELNLYWKEEVEKVEKNPQSDIAILKRRFLYAGNNYRRLVEPLDIAGYYREGGTEYIDRGRSRHYIMLEKWFEDAKLEPERSATTDLRPFLTLDSCFWAKVEEAMILVNQMKTLGVMTDEVFTSKLVSFEKYMLGMIERREVSPEIFLEKSSFMSWWKDYKKIKDGLHLSPSL